MLALHHIAPDMPLERSLPEPFRAQWLKIISGDEDCLQPDSWYVSE